MALREYQRKRDFSKTAEPAAAAGKPTSAGTLFVIQKHAASRLHYDLRLEMEGVLKSWAVPKGIPYEKGDKRLAVQVEDHPLEYARFEGIIPKGEYGGGTVMVWDIGEYSVSGDALAALAEGKLHLQFNGRKLKGEWTLVRTQLQRGNESDKPNWLLMKTGASIRPIGKRLDDQSALSNRTMGQIAADRDHQWHSNGVRPGFIQPMKPKLVDAPPEGPGWVFELKFDGYRALAIKTGSEVRIFSRNEKLLKFPEIAKALADLPCQSAVLDGEIVALDEEGRPSFQLLQAREMGDSAAAGEAALICYYLFDLIQIDGEDLRGLSLIERKARLAKLLKGARDPLRFSSDLPGEPAAVLAQVAGRGLEGIVAKRADSLYESGARTGAWRKVKCINEQEFVIGGYTEPQGTRHYFGSVLVGYYENGTLRFAGKVGTGFSDRLLQTLFRQFQAFRTENCPFVDLPSKSAGRWNQGITPAQMKRCRWVRPEMVCQVRFSEWTRDGKLRQPVFLGIREDRPAAAVVREGF